MAARDYDDQERRWALLLRGVNVGGVKVLSADLRDALAKAGFTSVTTVLASGNALVSSGGDAAAVRATAESSLARRFGRSIPLIVIGQAELADLARACPYPSDSPTHHAYLVFTDSPTAHRELAEAVIAAGSEPESATAGDQVIYWQCPVGSSLASPVAKVIDAMSRRLLTTTRNLRTVLKLTTG